MNQNTVAGGSRGGTGNSGQSTDFDGQHTYVIQDNRRESQDEELEGAGIEFIFFEAIDSVLILLIRHSLYAVVCLFL